MKLVQTLCEVEVISRMRLENRSYAGKAAFLGLVSRFGFVHSTLVAVVAAGCLVGLTFTAAAAGRIGVLDCGLASGTNAYGAATAPEAFVRALGGAYDVRIVPEAQAKADGLFDRTRTDLLVVPCGSLFPQRCARDLVTFLRKGGLLLTSGGYAFDTPRIHDEKGWHEPVRENMPTVVGATPVALPEPSAWKENTAPRSRTEITSASGEHGERAIRIASPLMKLYNLGAMRLPQEADVAHRGVISFRVKTSPNVKVLRVELNERDGTRWMANFPATGQWQTITLTWPEFEFHRDSSTRGKRGKANDRVRFPDVTQLVIGFSHRGNPVRVPMDLIVTDVRVGPDPFAAKRCRPETVARINAHHYGPGWTDAPRPDQIGIFSPAYLFASVPTVRNDELTKDLFPAIALSGSFAGYDASVQLTPHIWGHAKCRATLRPVLACRAADGALKGRAASLAYHYDSTFRGSAWALFGVDSADLFATPENDALLKAMVDALFRRTFLAETSPTWACYRPDETIELSTTVFNFGETPRTGSVRFVIFDEGGAQVARETIPYTVAPKGENAKLTYRWPAPARGDWYRFVAELVNEKGITVDREENAVSIWRDETIAKGPKVGRAGEHFTIDGTPRFLVGAQSYIARFLPYTSSSALPLYRNFKQMRENDLRVSRNFFPWSPANNAKRPDERERMLRLMDACVLLSQKFGIVNYFDAVCGNSIPTNAFDLATEANDVRFFAERYRAVPGFLMDVRNEPRLDVKKSARRDDRKNKAIFENWSRTLADAARRGNPSLDVATGWSQGWGGAAEMKDPPTACRPFTFTDCHYYGRNEGQLPEMKKIDRRVFGQPAVLGEFGVAFNPARIPFFESYATEEEAARRYRCQTIRTFGEGYSFLSNYGWADHIEGNTTFAFCHWDNNPREALAVYAKLARVLSRMPLAPNPPTAVLVLSESRFDLGPARLRAHTAYGLGAAALSWWGVNYSVVSEEERGKLPPSVRLVVTVDELIAAGYGNDELELSAARDYIGGRVKASGAFHARLESDPATLETYRVPGLGSTAWVFWNGDAKKAVRVERKGHALTVGPERGGYLEISDDGRVAFESEL